MTQTTTATYKGHTDIYTAPKFRVALSDFNPGATVPGGVLVSWHGESEALVVGRSYTVTFDRKAMKVLEVG